MNKEIISYAQIATEVYNELTANEKKQLIKFHLRPTQSGVTIISTLPYAAMRGICNLKTKKEIKLQLKKIAKNSRKIMCDDENQAIDYLQKLGFKTRLIKSKKPLEEDFQAKMINFMVESNLAKALKKREKIHFVASELTFEQGHHRVDVVGFDGTTVYLFELKKDRTTKVEQVKNYVDYYTSTRNISLFSTLLKNYPGKPVSQFTEVKGVMVMRHSENSANSNTWKNLAKKYNIDVLFFEESLNFKKVS